MPPTQNDREEDGSTFFDSLSRQWVRLDNFAFAEPDNHFGGGGGRDSGGGGSLVGHEALAAADRDLSVGRGEEDELEELFEQVRMSDMEQRFQFPVFQFPFFLIPGFSIPGFLVSVFEFLVFELRFPVFEFLI